MDSGQLPFEHLEVMDDPLPRTGVLNMAIDEVLLGRLHDCALLRVYRWAGPSVSFGYFESFSEAKRLAQGREIVRRWTGGGIVEHGEDLTYSLLVPRSSSFAKLRGVESYRLIHDAVARALHRIGQRTEMQGGRFEGQPPDAHSRACFEKPVSHDLLADGRKVAGGAQRRTRDGLLHQGSVRIAARKDDRHHDISSRLGGALPAEFGMNSLPVALADDELAEATSLAASKYAARRWLEKS